MVEDRLLHEPNRLMMVAALHGAAAGEKGRGVRFVQLKQLCQLTDGNLNRHVDALREEGLVEVSKGQGTWIRLTARGEQRLIDYVRRLELQVDWFRVRFSSSPKPLGQEPDLSSEPVTWSSELRVEDL